MIRKIFQEGIEPMLQCVPQSRKYRDEMGKYNDMQKNFIDRLSREQQKEFEQLIQLKIKLSAKELEESYVRGFKLGVELVIDVLN